MTMLILMDWKKKKDAILTHDILEPVPYQTLNLFTNIFIQTLQFIYLEKSKNLKKFFHSQTFRDYNREPHVG